MYLWISEKYNLTRDHCSKNNETQHFTHRFFLLRNDYSLFHIALNCKSFKARRETAVLTHSQRYCTGGVLFSMDGLFSSHPSFYSESDARGYCRSWKLEPPYMERTCGPKTALKRATWICAKYGFLLYFMHLTLRAV